MVLKEKSLLLLGTDVKTTLNRSGTLMCCQPGPALDL